MPNTTDALPLIEEARLMVSNAVAHSVRTADDCALAYIAGYDAGVESVHRDGVRDYSGALALANKRIAELEAQLEQSRPQAVGVVVTDKMAILYLKERQLSVYPEAIASVKDGITAALRGAHTVPLKSVEPVRWRSDDDGQIWGTRETALEGCLTTVTPLYAGLPEPAKRGEG